MFILRWLLRNRNTIIGSNVGTTMEDRTQNISHDFGFFGPIIFFFFFFKTWTFTDSHVALMCCYVFGCACVIFYRVNRTLYACWYLSSKRNIPKHIHTCVCNPVRNSGDRSRVEIDSNWTILSALNFSALNATRTRNVYAISFRLIFLTAKMCNNNRHYVENEFNRLSGE